MLPRALFVGSAGVAIGCLSMTAALSGCGDDDCSITLTCPPNNQSGGSGGTAGSGGTGQGGIDPNKKANGIGCGDNAECQTDQCIDGVCCATACDGTCESCNLTDTEGTCTPHPPGTDPETECGEGLCSGQPTCATGTELWSELVTSTGRLDQTEVALDSSGNIVLLIFGSGDISVAGTTIPSLGAVQELAVVKLSASGEEVLWSQSARLADNDYSGSAQMTVDINDGVIVVGYSQLATDLGGPTFGDSSNGDVFVVRLNADGSHDWTESMQKSAAFNSPEIQAITTDATGSVYLFGGAYSAEFYGCNKYLGDTSESMFFGVKLSPTGSCQWAQEWSITESATAYSLATSGSSVFVTGAFQGTLDLNDNTLSTPGANLNVFIAALDTVAGVHLWSDEFGDASSQSGRGLAIEPGGDLLLVADVEGGVDLGGGVLAASGSNDVVMGRFTADGAHVSSSRYGDDSRQRPTDLAVAADGTYYVVGTFDGTTDLGSASLSVNSPRAATLAFHPSGVGLWARSEQAPNGRRVAVAPNGNIVTSSATSTDSVTVMGRTP